jgi:hypothetical protein
MVPTRVQLGLERGAPDGSPGLGYPCLRCCERVNQARLVLGHGERRSFEYADWVAGAEHASMDVTACRHRHEEQDDEDAPEHPT